MINQLLQPGETSERFSCQNCNYDFAVILEPQLVDLTEQELKRGGVDSMKPALMQRCPFCLDGGNITDNA